MVKGFKKLQRRAKKATRRGDSTTLHLGKALVTVNRGDAIVRDPHGKVLKITYRQGRVKYNAADAKHGSDSRDSDR